MGSFKTLSNAKIELAELYSGIPDESVNLTFQDLATVKQNANLSDMKKDNITRVETIQEARNGSEKNSHLSKFPSLDFKRGLQAAKGPLQHQHQHHPHHDANSMHVPHGQHLGDHQSHHHGHAVGRNNWHHHAVESSMIFDDVSVNSMTSGYQDRGGTGRSRRPGIPHSNICTICSTYVYIFRHRCLVCGRVYCRNCVGIGMGEMAEGRKCMQCLGRRFSERYIQRAGMVGCCSRYPSAVKQAELKWAEKGPRGSGVRAYGRSTMMSRSIAPTVAMAHADHSSTNPPSFAGSSPYSPYSHKHHILPL